jgi:hypothetical protein
VRVYYNGGRSEYEAPAHAVGVSLLVYTHRVELLIGLHEEYVHDLSVIVPRHLYQLLLGILSRTWLLLNGLAYVVDYFPILSLSNHGGGAELTDLILNLVHESNLVL